MYLPSPFTSLPHRSEDRRRLGIKIQASLFFLLSPFTSLPQHSEDRRRLGKNLKQVWLFALVFHFFAASQRR